MNDVCSTPSLKGVDETIDDLIRGLVNSSGKERIKTEKALDRILATTLKSPFNFPPWPASAMDGYAFASTDAMSGSSFVIQGKALAGHPFTDPVLSGNCVRITTGAPLPEGTDTVEMQENCQISASSIELLQPITTGQNVRKIGSSTREGQTILEAGIRLGPKELALIASVGLAEIEVYKPLKIAIFSTGDELVPAGQELQPGKIYDSNRLTITTMCQRMGYETLDLGLIPDDPRAIRELMLEASRSADVLMTSGGVSVGEADYVKSIVEEIGELSVWKVAIKPGKPIAMGTIGDCYFFGLPGNPVSTIVTLNKLVKPALQKLSGQQVVMPMQFSAICQSGLRKRPGRRDYQRGIAAVDNLGQWQVKSTGPQGSARLESVTEANCYIILEVDCDGVAEGDTVTIELFDESLR